MNLSILPILISAICPRAILRDISSFWGFRSTVPGPQMHAASEFLLRRHAENGVEAEIHAYPAGGGHPAGIVHPAGKVHQAGGGGNYDRKVECHDYQLPQAWFPRSARLEIIEPAGQAGVICSYAEEPLCLISNSSGTPCEGVTAEVVIIPNAVSPEAYEGIDAAGKIVFTDVWPLQADEQAREHGAIGILTDSVTPPWLHQHPPVRNAADVPDLTMWGVLDGHPQEQPLWGFSLSPRQGASLRRILRDASEPVKLRVVIDAELKEGVSEVFTAFLPGTDLVNEEIWILSHSSEPGALDNASGCCAAIEIARVIKTLTETGALPPLRRSIRFLSALETYGYLPYIDERMNVEKSPEGRHGLGTTVTAALAFDSIGADFRKTGSTLRINRSPDYNPSFADDLLESILEAVANEQNERFTSDNYDLFPWQVDPCFPANDNMIADGYYDVPTPMLDCWPDKFYHSNLDTPDKLSEGSLARCTVIAAAYVYLLATAGFSEARQMAGLSLQAWKRRMIGGADQLQGVDALQTVLRLEPSLEAEITEMSKDLLEFGQRERESALRWGITPASAQKLEADETINVPGNLDEMLLSPNCWRIPDKDNLSPEGIAELNALIKHNSGIESVWWLINGRRTARQICQRTELPAAAVLDYLGLMRNEAKITCQAK